MKRLLVFIMMMLVFSIGSVALSHAVQVSDLTFPAPMAKEKAYSRLIVGLWEWKGDIEGRPLIIRWEYRDDKSAVVEFFDQKDGGKEPMFSVLIGYEIENNKIRLFAPDRWGLSEIIKISKEEIILREIGDHTGPSVNKPVVTYRRLK